MNPLYYAGLIVAALAGGAAVFGHLRAPNTPRASEYPAGPIRIWAEQTVNQGSFMVAVDAWRDIGWPILVTESNPSVLFTTRPGLVLGGKAMCGIAHIRGDRVTVELVPGSDSLVIAHEMGHAFGFRHTRIAPTGSLMAAGVERIGWNMRGLEYGGRDGR